MTVTQDVGSKMSRCLGKRGQHTIHPAILNFYKKCAVLKYKKLESQNLASNKTQKTVSKLAMK